MRDVSSTVGGNRGTCLAKGKYENYKDRKLDEAKDSYLVSGIFCFSFERIVALPYPLTFSCVNPKEQKEEMARLAEMTSFSIGDYRCVLTDRLS